MSMASDKAALLIGHNGDKRCGGRVQPRPQPLQQSGVGNPVMKAG